MRDYNTFCNNVPFVFFAPSLGFRKAPFFDVTNTDSLENVNTFSADDGTILREKFAGASTQVLQSTKAFGNTLETHGRALLERGQAGFQKRQSGTDVSSPAPEDESDEPKP